MVNRGIKTEKRDDSNMEKEERERGELGGEELQEKEGRGERGKGRSEGNLQLPGSTWKFLIQKEYSFTVDILSENR